MREKTVCFTGHRIIPPEKGIALSAQLQEEIKTLIQSGYRYFGAGGALGFDTIAEQAVLQLRHDFPQIRLILVLPCKDQTRGMRSCIKQIRSFIQLSTIIEAACLSVTAIWLITVVSASAT